MAPVAGQKRKIDYNPPGTAAQARKRQKGKDARAIPTQTADAALSTTGELNIGSFVRAREFEIAALEQSMKKSRKGLTQRAFQAVPRHMRRRTASHNVKKIPRRLRGRAAKEIAEDNTPTGSARKRKPSAKLRLRIETAKKLQKLNANRKSVRQRNREAKLNAKESDPEQHVDTERIPRIKKNKLAQPPQATSKYKRRQVNKTWLPTHLWHTKRAHMTRPTLPLWRMAIPLRPTEKTYRPAHRASGARGCIAWDMSYMSTLGCQGTEVALEGMLKSLGFAGGGCTGAQYRRWKAGTRYAEGWAYERDNEKKCIAPMLVLWQVKLQEEETLPAQPDQMEVDHNTTDEVQKPKDQKKPKLDRSLFIRIHPSVFHLFWSQLLKVAKMQKPQVLVEDLRFEIGSIEIQGPGSTEALVGVFKLANNQPNMEKTWPTLSSLNNTSSLPQNAMLAFSTTDPRLNHPPRQIPVAKDDATINKLNELIVAWPLDRDLPPSKLFNYKERYRTSKALPSQKAINRRRTTLLPGQQLEPTEKEPRIPVILLAHRSPNKNSNSQGSWSVLLPWACVDPAWRSLMYYSLTSGSTPRFGGLEQTQQVAFEQAVPWYPGDYPGTEAGKVWDRTESESRFDDWVRRPPSKRLAWDTLDLGLDRKGELGRGWACDWEYLLRRNEPKNKSNDSKGAAATKEGVSKSSEPRLLTQRQRKAADFKAEKEKEKKEEQEARRRNTSSPESEQGDEYDTLHNDVKYTQLVPAEAAKLFDNFKQALLPPVPALATVRIKCLTKGTPKPAARIYRLPSRQPSTTNGSTGTKNAEKGQETPQPKATITEQGSQPVTPAFLAEPDSKSIQATIETSTLRAHWLALDPNPTSQTPNPTSSTTLPKYLGSMPYNHSALPTAPRTYDPTAALSLTHIRVFPPHETKPEVLNMFGPKPPPRTKEELEKLYVPQLLPRMVVNAEGEVVEEGLWDRHVPCPEADDLIGFVTSGGYNLAEGGGTAVGGVWAQRVVGGWRVEGKDEDKDPARHEETNSRAKQSGDAEGEAEVGGSDLRQGRSTDGGGGAKEKEMVKKTKQDISRQKHQQTKLSHQHQKQKQPHRERHLCIVRNAGESIGRLAVWELC